MVFIHPAQEGQVFVQDRFFNGRIATLLFERGDFLSQQLLHARKITNRQLEVIQALVDAFDNLLVAFGTLAFDDDQHHRFLEIVAGLDTIAIEITMRGHDRMEHRPDRNPLVDQLTHDGLDDERRVALYNFNHVVCRRLAFVIENRRDALQGLGAVALATILPESCDDAIEIPGGQVGQFIGVEILQYLGQEISFALIEPEKILHSPVCDKCLYQGVLGGGLAFAVVARVHACIST